MPEIIPNFHPLFVHFTVALFMLSVGLFVVTPFMKPRLREQWQTVARWALWFGAGLTVITGLTGLDAYNTVAHDAPSHAAMTDHRNWAIATMALFLGLTAWSIIRVRRKQALGTVFIVAMVIAGGLLASTAWRGGELVYRYGLGVMSLPTAEEEGEEEGEAHEHDGGNDMEGTPAHSNDDAATGDADTGTAVEPHDEGHDHDSGS